MPRDALTSCQQLQIVPAPAKTDILFVIDDSGSMAASQQNLADNFQAFIDRLAQSPVKNDYQIGVTTTSVDRYAPSSSTPYDVFNGAGNGSCPNPPYPPNTPYPKGALVSVTGGAGAATRVQSAVDPADPPRILSASLSPNDLVADFAKNVFVGVCGAGKEQGLEAARLALSEPLLSGANAGFLRSGSRLAVIIVSDDDDCSDPQHQGSSGEPTNPSSDGLTSDCTRYSVQNYVDFFKGLGRDVVVGAIIAVDPTSLDPVSCLEPGNVRAEHPAYRYQAFAGAFQSSIVDSVCNASFHDTLVRIAGLIDPGQTLPLSGAPADPRLLGVRVNKASGDAVVCRVGLAGDASANVVYAPPAASDPATLTFSGSCTLQQGDRVDVAVLCAG